MREWEVWIKQLEEDLRHLSNKQLEACLAQWAMQAEQAKKELDRRREK